MCCVLVYPQTLLNFRISNLNIAMNFQLISIKFLFLFYFGHTLYFLIRQIRTVVWERSVIFQSLVGTFEVGTATDEVSKQLLTQH